MPVQERSQPYIALPEPVQALLRGLDSCGFAAYAVGGCVRDALLGKTPHDWDVCTSAAPEQVEACFPGVRMVETGLKHGTVTLVLEGRPYEVTTFRRESGYADHRRPDRVTFVSDLATDLGRRDFTVNAMAYRPDTGLVDLYGGLGDLAAGVIRCVGAPEERFSEDGLRILRALRFAARLGFSIEEKTAAALHACRELLRAVSQERIFAELRGILAGPGAGPLLSEFSDVLFVILPELKPMEGLEQKTPYHCYDVWGHTLRAVDAAPADALLRLALLFHDAGKPETMTVDAAGTGHFYGHAARSEAIARCALNRLRCDNETARAVGQLVRRHDGPPPQTAPQLRRLIGQLGEPLTRQLLALRRADILALTPAFQAPKLEALDRAEALLDELLAQAGCFGLKNLAVNGRDLLALGFAPGKPLGAALNALLLAVQDEQLPNEKAALLEKAAALLEGEA